VITPSWYVITLRYYVITLRYYVITLNQYAITLSYVITLSYYVLLCFFSVYLGYHTGSQVMWGGIVGLTLGCVWFAVVQIILTPFFPYIAAR